MNKASFCKHLFVGVDLCVDMFSNTLNIPCGKSLFKEIHFYMCVWECMYLCLCVCVYTQYFILVVDLQPFYKKKKAFFGGLLYFLNP